LRRKGRRPGSRSWLVHECPARQPHALRFPYVEATAEWHELTPGTVALARERDTLGSALKLLEKRLAKLHTEH
jgi:hypothetical protein